MVMDVDPTHVLNALDQGALHQGGDLITFGTMAALDEMGLSAPEDIAFIGFDDILAAASFRPPLTTVH